MALWPWGTRVAVEVADVEVMMGVTTLTQGGIVAIEGFVRQSHRGATANVIWVWVEMIDWPELSGWYLGNMLTRSEVNTDDAAG